MYAFALRGAETDKATQPAITAVPTSESPAFTMSMINTPNNNEVFDRMAVNNPLIGFLHQAMLLYAVPQLVVA